MHIIHAYSSDQERKAMKSYLKKQGHEVKVLLGDSETSLERYGWTCKNADEMFCIDWHGTEVSYFFKSLDDATIFKMRWG